MSLPKESNYCLKCKNITKSLPNPEIKTSKNGRRYYVIKCSVCDKRTCVFLKTEGSKKKAKLPAIAAVDVSGSVVKPNAPKKKRTKKPKPDETITQAIIVS